MLQRKDYILKLIVEHFIKTAQPVASKTLIEVYGLSFSSATIRNEMQALEEEGLLEKTHTSSGRIPSTEGYKYYVNNLRDFVKHKDIKYQLQTILNERVKTVEDILSKSCEVLSSMTNLASIVLGGDDSNESLVSLQLLPISSNSGTVLFVTNQGKVVNKTFFFDEKLKLEDLQKCIDILSKRLINTPLKDLGTKLELLKPIILDYIIDGDVLYQTILRTLTTLANNRVILYGKDHLLDQPEFAEDPKLIKTLVEMLDSPQFFQNISNVSYKTNDITVKIGNEDTDFQDISIISAKLDLPGCENNVISLIGPKRMDYDQALNAIRTLIDEINEKYYGGSR
jgi:heat-inducible transcriptional repressor